MVSSVITILYLYLFLLFALNRLLVLRKVSVIESRVEGLHLHVNLAEKPCLVVVVKVRRLRQESPELVPILGHPTVGLVVLIILWVARNRCNPCQSFLDGLELVHNQTGTPREPCLYIRWVELFHATLVKGAWHTGHQLVFLMVTVGRALS